MSDHPVATLPALTAQVFEPRFGARVTAKLGALAAAPIEVLNSGQIEGLPQPVAVHLFRPPHAARQIRVVNPDRADDICPRALISYSNGTTAGTFSCDWDGQFSIVAAKVAIALVSYAPTPMVFRAGYTPQWSGAGVASADPGIGTCEANGSEPLPQLTTLKVSNVAASGLDFRAALAGFEGYLRIFARTNPTKWLRFRVTSVSQTYALHSNLTVSLDSYRSVGPLPASGEACILEFTRGIDLEAREVSLGASIGLGACASTATFTSEGFEIGDNDYVDGTLLTAAGDNPGPDSTDDHAFNSEEAFPSMKRGTMGHVYPVPQFARRWTPLLGIGAAWMARDAWAPRAFTDDELASITLTIQTRRLRPVLVQRLSNSILSDGLPLPACATHVCVHLSQQMARESYTNDPLWTPITVNHLFQLGI